MRHRFRRVIKIGNHSRAISLPPDSSHAQDSWVFLLYNDQYIVIFRAKQGQQFKDPIEQLTNNHIQSVLQELIEQERGAHAPGSES